MTEVVIVSAAASPVMLTPRDAEVRLRAPVLATVPLGAVSYTHLTLPTKRIV